MGTRFELVLDGDDEDQLRAAGEAALEEISLAERELSPFRPDSQISHLNRHGAEGPVRLDPEVLRLLSRCQDLWRATDQAFDPGLGLLMELLGFRDGASGKPAQAAAAQALRETAGLRHLEVDLEAGTARFTSPALRLDLGAIGKGYALDRAAEVLREAGVRCALLHGGTSTVLTIGSAPPGEPHWTIGLDDPRPGYGRLGEVRLGEGALGVSAQHGRIAASGAGGHILDPRSGRSSDAALLAAVLHPSATSADAWSTALCAGARVESAASDPGLTVLVVRGTEDPSEIACRVAGPRADSFVIRAGS
jgi:thiamine biosynthesis lipoprotein